MIQIAWSLSRERMFARCPREMYLHYIASAGGNDPDAPVLTRDRYFCRRIQPAHYYARFAVTAALREIFYYENKQSVTSLVLRRLARDRHAAARGDNLDDNALPVWSDPENLQGCVDDLLQMPQLPELVEFLRRKSSFDRELLPDPLSAPLGDLTLYASPVLALRDAGKFVFLTFEAHESVDTVLCRYALYRKGIAPDRVGFLRYDGRREDAMRLHFSQELEHILHSAARMYDGIYPKCGDAGVCRQCRFRFCCED